MELRVDLKGEQKTRLKLRRVMGSKVRHGISENLRPSYYFLKLVEYIRKYLSQIGVEMSKIFDLGERGVPPM